jgi:hypothetical protein
MRLMINLSELSLSSYFQPRYTCHALLLSSVMKDVDYELLHSRPLATPNFHFVMAAQSNMSAAAKKRSVLRSVTICLHEHAGLWVQR